jgi:hypothetical protein
MWGGIATAAAMTIGLTFVLPVVHRPRLPVHEDA